MSKLNNKGFAVVEATLILVIVGALAGIGYYVYQQQNSKTSSTNDQASVQKKDDVPSVNKASDLAKADKYLDDTDVDKQLDTTALDSTVN